MNLNLMHVRARTHLERGTDLDLVDDVGLPLIRLHDRATGVATYLHTAGADLERWTSRGG